MNIITPYSVHQTALNTLKNSKSLNKNQNSSVQNKVIPVNFDYYKAINYTNNRLLVSFGQNNPKNGESLLNEIKQQPQIIRRLTDKFFPVDQEQVQGININNLGDLNNINKIQIIACGSSANAGQVAKNAFESIANIPVEVNLASEFKNGKTPVSPNDLIIVISQSGETEDTFAALNVAKERGAKILALTNQLGSSINKAANSEMYVEASKEVNIAATKSVTAQMLNLYALALYMGEQKGTIEPENSEKLKQELRELPEKIDNLINNDQEIKIIAKKIKNRKRLAVLGMGPNFGVAKEGALKITETNGMTIVGQSTGEFLHGHRAAVDKHAPVISIIVPGETNNYEDCIKYTQETKEKRQPPLTIIKSQNDFEIEDKFQDADFINIPETSELISPFLTIISLQLLALRTAQAAGKDPNGQGLSKVQGNLKK